VLSQGEPRDATVNFDTLQRHHMRGFVRSTTSTRKNQSDRIFYADKYITWSLSITTDIIIHRQRNGSN